MAPQDITGDFGFMKPKQKIVMIASPAYRSIYTSAYVESFFGLTNEARKKNIGLAFAHVDTADIVLSRNYLASRFYFDTPEATHLLFIDNDMGFSPSLIIQMLELDTDVVGTVYAKRKIDLEKLHSNGELPFRRAYAEACEFVGQNVWSERFIVKIKSSNGSETGNPIQVKNQQVPFSNTPFIRAKRVGTGILLIKREAITKMINKCPDISRTKKPRGSKDGMFAKLSGYITPFNKVEVDGYELSEDFSFCHRWTEQCGGAILASTSSRIKHVGEMTIETKFSDTWES